MPFDTTCPPMMQGLRGLSAAALRAFADTIPSLYAESDLRRLPGVFTEVLSRLLPAESHAVVICDRARGQRSWSLRPASADHESRVPMFFSHLDEFAPVIYRRRTGSGEALALSDFLSVSELEGLGMYGEYYRPSGLKDDLTISVTLDDVVVNAAVMKRRRGFRSEEREMLNAFRPHVRQAWTNARTFTRLAARVKPESRAWLPQTLEKCFRLTPREAEVMLWVAEGKTNPEAADILGIRPYTVRTHLERIFTKLGVSSRHAATLRVLEVLKT